MKVTQLIPALLFCGLFVLTSGRHRDDVPERKYLDLAMQSQFNCVGSILLDGDQEASCVLIADRYVLTAAHCLVEGFNYKPFTVTQKDGSVLSGNAATEERLADTKAYHFV